jgi:hypothetical protein
MRRREPPGCHLGRRVPLCPAPGRSMDYRVRASHRCLYALSSEQVPFDGAWLSAPAHYPRLYALGTQPIHYLPAEPSRAAGDQYVSHFHDQNLLLSFTFFGLTAAGRWARECYEPPGRSSPLRIPPRRPTVWHLRRLGHQSSDPLFLRPYQILSSACCTGLPPGHNWCAPSKGHAAEGAPTSRVVTLASFAQRMDDPRDLSRGRRAFLDR